jgi:5-methylthioadenosine/S-adenosylhomocysteine deaminase
MALVIRGGRVLDSDSLELVEADVVIEKGRITAVGKGIDAPESAQIRNASGKLVLPGLINAHTHSHNNLSKSFGDNWSLENQLNHSAALLTGRAAEDYYVSAAIGAIEMLKTGCTAAYDLFMALPSPTEEGIGAIVRAYQDVGLRAVLAPAVADIVFYRTVPKLFDLLPDDLRSTVSSMKAAPTQGLLDITEHHIRQWDGASNGRIRAAVSPTIPGQCTDEFLAGCARLVREYGVGLHTHLQETKVQVVHSLNQWGKTPTERLADYDLLSPDFVGAHGVWLNDMDCQHLSSAGGSIVHNPASNLKLGSGIAPVREFFDRGINVGLGTDGSASSDNQNLFGAMHFAGLVGKVRFPHDPDRWIGAADVWNMVTAGSARALGMAEDIGAVAPGRKADVIILDSDSVYLRPLNQPINALVYAEAGSAVETAIVDGRVVMDQGKVLGVNETRLRELAQDAAERIWRENQQLWTLAEQLDPYVSAACKAAVAVPYSVNRYAVSCEVSP